MDCRARVMEKEGDRALVRVARVNCAECGGCGLLSRDREHTMEFFAVDRLSARVGDEVILKVPSRRLVLSYLTVFGLPLLVMAAVYFAVAAIFAFAFGGDGTAAGIVAAVLCGLVSLWAGVKLADRLGLSPVIVEVIAAGEEDDGEQGYVL
jgi:positive regulator of sigma E activity